MPIYTKMTNIGPIYRSTATSNVAGNPDIPWPCIQKIHILFTVLKYSRSMIVCHSEHSFCTDFSILELYLADSGKYSR